METKIKGVTTGVKGGIPIKIDHKGTLEIKYLNEASYDKDNTLKDIITFYEQALNEQEQTFNDKIDKLSSEHDIRIKTLETTINETLKGLITR